MSIYAALEVSWYRANGRYPERIARTNDGDAYVIGDEGWNRRHPDKPEFVEGGMSDYVKGRLSKEQP